MSLFSEVLGLGVNLLGMGQANSNAKRQARLMERQIDGMLEISRGQLELQERNQDLIEEDYARRVEIEQLNRALMEQEREWQLGELEYYREQLKDDQDRQIQRQLEMDREAAAIQAWRLEQLDWARDMAADERSYALEMLQEAKAIASGERDEQLKRFYEDRMKAATNRDWQVGQYESARRQARSEREFDLSERDMVTDRIMGLERSLEDALKRLGDPMELYRTTPEEIEGEYRRRASEYQSDVDRAATRVASIGEADLIRTGMDVSTTGTARRGEITERIAAAYQDARQRAYDDALAYIGGRQTTLNAPVGQDMERRSGVLREVANVTGAPIEALMSRSNPSSELPAYNIASLVGSGILDRGISSANAYSAPMPIGSALIDGTGSYAPGISEYEVRTSLADPSYLNIMSAVFDPYSQNVPNPAAFGSNAVSAGGAALSARSGMYGSAMDTAFAASRGLGASLRGLGAELGASWGNWGGGGGSLPMTPSTSTPTYSPPPMMTAPSPTPTYAPPPRSSSYGNFLSGFGPQ